MGENKQNIVLDLAVEAISHFNRKEKLEAISKCEEAMAADPEAAEPYFILGVIAFTQREQGKALQLVERAHDLDPNCWEYAQALSNIYTRIGKLADGLFYAKLATTLERHAELSFLLPDFFHNYMDALKAVSPSSHFIEGWRAMEQVDFAKAELEFRREVEINRDHRNANLYLAKCQIWVGRPDQGLATARAAVHHFPDDAAFHLVVAEALVAMGDPLGARASVLQAVDLAPGDPAVASAAEWLSSYDPYGYPALRSEIVDRLLEQVDGIPDLTMEGAWNRDEDRPLHLGIVATGLTAGRESRFIEAFLNHHRSERMKITVYQISAQRDRITSRLRAQADSWREMFDLDDFTAALTLFRDEVDAVVNLCNGTFGERTRMLLACTGAAHVSWLAVPEGAGGSTTNVVLSDAVTKDVDAALLREGQTCVEADRPLVALERPVLLPEVGALPAAQNGFVVFGASADMSCFNPMYAGAVATILLRVPNSRFLMWAPGGISPDLHRRLIETFGNFGVAERFEIAELPDEMEATEGWGNFLNSVDVFLDTFPVSGGAELGDALWMGVPFVSLRGDRRRGLVGSQILAAAGASEWIADDRRAYVEIALGLARDIEALASTRSELRGRVEQSQLFDCNGLVEAMEMTVKAAVERVRGTS